jgi:hypothetical protein
MRWNREGATGGQPHVLDASNTLAARFEGGPAGGVRVEFCAGGAARP